MEVEDPRHPDQTLVCLRLFNGAVATSSTLGRRWGPGLHHIIDPASGRPASSGLVAATVVADGAARADILAKACIVLGRERGLALLQAKSASGLLVAEDGRVTLTRDLEVYLHAKKQG